MIFDSHAHYDDKQFGNDRPELLLSMVEHQIGRIVNVGASLESSRESIALAGQYDFIYAAIGVHPSDISCLEESEQKPYEDGSGFCGTGLEWLKSHSADPKVVAIGEIGLDYYWEKDPANQELQKKWFVRQLQLARECGLPVIIHSRDAASDTMEIMKAHGAGIPGVIHCYSYAKEMALEYVAMGYYIGVGGVVTFKNARKLIETVEAIPLERIVIETDCPYLAPEPYRGKRNSSLNLPYVVERIASLKGVSERQVEEAAWENACTLYRLK